VAAAAEYAAAMRADIHRQLAVLIELAGQLDDLAGTRQATGLGFLTPEGREQANRQAIADRLVLQS
jgi:hypothetical protein